MGDCGIVLGSCSSHMVGQWSTTLTKHATTLDLATLENFGRARLVRLPPRVYRSRYLVKIQPLIEEVAEIPVPLLLCVAVIICRRNVSTAKDVTFEGGTIRIFGMAGG